MSPSIYPSPHANTLTYIPIRYNNPFPPQNEQTYTPHLTFTHPFIKNGQKHRANLRVCSHGSQFGVYVLLGLTGRGENVGRRKLVLVAEGCGLEDIVLPHRGHVTLVGYEQYWDGRLTKVFLW